MKPRPMDPKRLRQLLVLFALLSAITFAGCRRSPTVNILGSYFPAWLICLFAGIVLALVAHRVFAHFRLDKEILWPIVVYPCLTLLFTCLLWLILFS
jgi:hypothetical protein